MKDNESVTVALLKEVAARSGEQITELPPLDESVDPEALNRLFAATAKGQRGGRVAFEYAEYLVTVSQTADVTISVTEHQPDRENQLPSL